VRRVGVEGALARPALDDDLETHLDERRRGLRRECDAALAGRDLPRNGDLHAGALMGDGALYQTAEGARSSSEAYQSPGRSTSHHSTISRRTPATGGARGREGGADTPRPPPARRPRPLPPAL